MAAKGHYIMIDESILSDTKIEDLLMALGYEGFGLYVAFLTLIRNFDSTGYKVPLDRLEILARRHLLLHTEEELESFSEFIATSVQCGLLQEDDKYIWSERRRIDLLKQENIRQKQKESAIKTNSKRFGNLGLNGIA